MKFEAEGTGKKIEEAIENALLELQVPREDVDIKIIDQGGFFKKAKVLVSISEDARSKYAKYEKKVVTQEAPKEQPKIETKAEEKKQAVKAPRKVITEDEFVRPVKEEKKAFAKTDKPTVRREKISNVTPKEFLEGLLAVCQKTATINERVTEDGATVYNITGENMSDFIGHRGDALYSISYLTSILASRDEKVRVDVEGYRERRIETLKALAIRVAEKVAKTGRYAKLEPMDAGERRIIHMTLQENTEVETISKGQEPHRFLMVISKKGNKPQENKEEVEEVSSEE